MADELIDVVDENNNLTGEQVMKSKAHKEGILHRAIHIWIYNSKGEILVQLRAKDKILLPALWDVAVGGHISTGEEPVTSAIRELEEEIGISAKESELIFDRITRIEADLGDLINKEFIYVYTYNYEGPTDNLKLQKEEVAEIKFVPIKELEVHYKENPDKYVPHGNYWDIMINKLKEKNKSD